MEKDKKVILVGAVLISLVAVFTFVRPFFGKSKDSSGKDDLMATEEAQYSFISAVDLKKQLNNTTIFDSRSDEEFRTEHLIGSFNVTLDNVGQYLEKADQTKKIIVVGSNSNDLSAKMLAQKLKDGGMENFSILSGGLASWIAEGGQTFRLGNPNSLADQAKINIVKPEELKSALDLKDPKIYILDLRSSSQFASEHLPQAKNIPADQLEEKFKTIPSGKNIVYYAGSELESFQYGVSLFELGFPGGSALEGGIEAWKKKDFPVEK